MEKVLNFCIQGTMTGRTQCDKPNIEEVEKNGVEELLQEINLQTAKVSFLWHAFDNATELKEKTSLLLQWLDEADWLDRMEDLFYLLLRR